jgi:hypothetical protein
VSAGPAAAGHEAALLRCAALRHALSGLDPLQGRTLAALAEAAERDPALVGEILANMRDIGRVGAAGMSAVDGNSAVALASFRYCLGRMTHVTGVCSHALEAGWGSIFPAVREAIVTEASAAIAEGRAGMPCDEQAWQRVIDRADGSGAAVRHPGR